MTMDVYEFMGKNFPTLTDLMTDINVHSGSFGQDRIGGTIKLFVRENDLARLRAAIQEIDRACQQLPVGREHFEDMMNYILQTDDDVLALLRTLRQGLQEGLAIKLSAESQAKI
nr:hypothetical protein [uncultured Dongia sp.]